MGEALKELGKAFYTIAIVILTASVIHPWVKGSADVNCPASKMWGFGWVYTLFGVPYHHRRVHSASTPTYPAIQRDSGATFSPHTRL